MTDRPHYVFNGAQLSDFIQWMIDTEYYRHVCGTFTVLNDSQVYWERYRDQTATAEGTFSVPFWFNDPIVEMEARLRWGEFCSNNH